MSQRDVDSDLPACVLLSEAGDLLFQELQVAKATARPPIAVVQAPVTVRKSC